MFIELPKVMGRTYRVCSPVCIREMRWRDVLSTMGEEYSPDPDPYKEDV